MLKLYSYRVKHDQGSAPNPFGGVCTLVICKPAIRRTAKKGDWIVGTGSAKCGFEDCVIYAMEVTEVMTMEKYDKYCNAQLLQKIPNLKSDNFEERIGDCIYDYSTNPETIRCNITGHDESYRKHDTDGKNALLSDHFYYFGSKPLELKGELKGIIKKGPGHKSGANDKYFKLFIDWITEQKDAKNKVFADPYLKDSAETYSEFRNKCSSIIQHNSNLKKDKKLHC